MVASVKERKTVVAAAEKRSWMEFDDDVMASACGL